jgi:hypothetical protein
MITEHNQKTVEGTSMRFVVTIEIDDWGLTADDVDFICCFYVYPDKGKTFQKGQMQRVDENRYAVTLDTAGMGKGYIRYQVEVTLPSGEREIVKGQTFETLHSGLC